MDRLFETSLHEAAHALVAIGAHIPVGPIHTDPHPKIAKSRGYVDLTVDLDDEDDAWGYACACLAGRIAVEKVVDRAYPVDEESFSRDEKEARAACAKHGLNLEECRDEVRRWMSVEKNWTTVLRVAERAMRDRTVEPEMIEKAFREG